MNLRICGSFSGLAFTQSKILPEISSSRSIWRLIFSSLMDSFRRFISAMARLPSEIILSSSALPVGSGFSSTSSTTSLQKSRAMRYTAADAAAHSAKCPTRYSGNSSAYRIHTTAAA